MVTLSFATRWVLSDRTQMFVLHMCTPRYASKLGNSKPRNAGSFKKELSGEARDLLRSSLATEYELVDFLRRRFELQKIALGIQ